MKSVLAHLELNSLIEENFTLDTEEAERVVHEVGAFEWGEDSEAKGSPRAIARMGEYLASAASAADSFRLIDTRGDQKRLMFSVDNVNYKGTCEAILSPTRVVDNYAECQVRVLFDWKLPDNATFSKVHSQMLLELLGGTASSNHPVTVVCTDLCSKGHVFFAKEDAVRVYKDLTFPQTLAAILDVIRLSSDAPNYRVDIQQPDDNLDAPSLAMKRIKTRIDRNEAFEDQLSLIRDAPIVERFGELSALLRTWNCDINSSPASPAAALMFA